MESVKFGQEIDGLMRIPLLFQPCRICHDAACALQSFLKLRHADARCYGGNDALGIGIR